MGAASAPGDVLGSTNVRQNVTVARAHRWGDTTANRAAALEELTARKVPTTTGSAIWAAAQVQRLPKT